MVRYIIDEMKIMKLLFGNTKVLFWVKTFVTVKSNFRLVLSTDSSPIFYKNKVGRVSL